jgi:endonuclease/exonuclease/phosphatase family metal-dependent hydrolase
MSATFSITTVNLHAGIDGWGRPFPAVDRCAAFSTDVLLIQENWTPEGEPSIAAEIAAKTGMHLVETTYATGRRGHANPEASEKWLSKKGFLGHDHSLYFDSVKPLKPSIAARAHYQQAERGAWGTAILSRFPISATSVLDLPYLRRDRSHRRPLVATLSIAGVEVTVICVHMSHLTYGSMFHFHQFNRELHALGVESKPIVIGGDMNNWGPPVITQVRGVARAVRGRTWPAWRPHSQLDHLLVSRYLAVESGQVLGDIGSDHLPVSATLRVTPPSLGN